VAALPDLSKMISKTYVTEIDISKVKQGQKAIVTIDAFPDKKLNGIVREVANIGEQIQGSNAKVFEVVIDITEFDSILRPAMTTKNQIITKEFKDVLYVPSEAVHTEGKTTFVYSQGNKVEVKTGDSNENHIIIEEGLEEGDEVLLTIPPTPEKWKLIPLSGREKKPEARKETGDTLKKS